MTMDQKPPMRRLLLLAALPLAACGESDSGQERAAAADEKLDCAIGGAEAFEPVCTVERATSGESLVLTVRAPGGGFRRLLVTTDGRGVIAADGAEEAVVTPLDGSRIEVAVGPDRYRLPATVKQ